MHPTLKDSPRYTSFVADRDQALERVLRNTLIDLSRILYNALEGIERLASQLALKSQGPFAASHQLYQRFDAGCLDILNQTFPIVLKRFYSMRKAVFILTYASEQEAIGRATSTKKVPLFGKDVFKGKIHKALGKPTLEGPLDKRIWLSLMKLKHRLSNAFLAAVMNEKKPQEIVQAVTQAFPQAKVYKRPPKALKKLKEARFNLVEEDDNYFDFGFIDEADWDLALAAYKDTELPANRFDNVAEYDPDSGMMAYDWELETEATEDFVKQVRDGQVEAANDLGVEEFVWVAVLDDKTCDECCAPRNGKTTSEIEEMDDDCDESTPPAHFNCRCQLSPVASVDEVEGPNWESFNDWIES